MAHYAKVESGIVTNVIVAESEFINTLPDSSLWIQTSYNTRGNVHYNSDNEPDGGVALRKNFAGIGFSYNADLDGFIPPKEFDSWILDTDTCLWYPPVDRPNDGLDYVWDEESVCWTLVTD